MTSSPACPVCAAERLSAEIACRVCETPLPFASSAWLVEISPNKPSSSGFLETQYTAHAPTGSPQSRRKQEVSSASESGRPSGKDSPALFLSRLGRVLIGSTPADITSMNRLAQAMSGNWDGFARLSARSLGQLLAWAGELEGAATLPTFISQLAQEEGGRRELASQRLNLSTRWQRVHGVTSVDRFIAEFVVEFAPEIEPKFVHIPLRSPSDVVSFARAVAQGAHELGWQSGGLVDIFRRLADSHSLDAFGKLNNMETLVQVSCDWKELILDWESTRDATKSLRARTRLFIDSLLLESAATALEGRSLLELAQDAVPDLQVPLDLTKKRIGEGHGREAEIVARAFENRYFKNQGRN